jgi:hypothetical protein
MTHAHKLRDKKIRGRDMLRCKRCGLTCSPETKAQIEATKCPGRA